VLFLVLGNFESRNAFWQRFASFFCEIGLGFDVFFHEFLAIST